MSSLAEVGQLLPQDVHLATVHELDDVVYGVSLQLQAKILQPREIFKLTGLRRRASAPGQNPPVYGERETFKFIDHDYRFTASHFSSRPKSSSLREEETFKLIYQ